MLKKARKYIIGSWVVVLSIFGYYLLNNPGFLKPENIAALISSFGFWALGIYAIVFFFRGLILVPSTPLVVVGVILFPDNPHFVFATAMIGIIFSSFIIYNFSDILGLDDYFASHVENEKIKKAIKKYGFFAVTFWSFFLVLPTDLICYIAGAVRMNIYKFLLAVFIGEAFIIGIFVYGGVHLLDYVTKLF